MSESGFGIFVITQHPVLIITQGQQGFGRVWLEFLRILQSSSRLIATSGGLVCADEVKRRVGTRKSCPGERKIGVELHGSFVRIDGFPLSSVRVRAARFKRHAAQIRIVSLRIVCGLNCEGLLFATG